MAVLVTISTIDLMDEAAFMDLIGSTQVHDFVERPVTSWRLESVAQILQVISDTKQVGCLPYRRNNTPARFENAEEMICPSYEWFT